MDHSQPTKRTEEPRISDEHTTGATGNEVPVNQSGGITDKHDINAGSGAFNQGSAQDPDQDRGAADQTPDPENASREPQNPKTPLGDDEV